MEYKKKNGFLAFCFSFIPGAAEMYMGFMKNGLSIMVSFAVIISVFYYSGLDGLASLAIAVWLFAIVHIFSKDYFGYLIVMLNNVTAVCYSKFTESYRSNTGGSNLKLLVYNNYLNIPVLLASLFISKEYLNLKNYFMEPEKYPNNFRRQGTAI